MKAEEIKNNLLTANENILRSLSSSSDDIFTNLKGLTFRLDLSDEVFPIGRRGFCAEFKNYEEAQALFTSLEIIDFEEKLRRMCNSRRRAFSSFYLIFWLRRNFS